MEELDRIGFDYKLNIVGGFSPDDVLIKKYKPKHVNFIGQVPQDNLKEYLSSSDCYLFPSLCEGCAQSVEWRHSQQDYLIATCESGLPITDGKDGLIIKTANVMAIVDAISKIEER